MAPISRRPSFRSHRKRPRQQQSINSLRWTLQAGIVVATGLFYFIARDAPILEQLFNEEATVFQRSLSANDALELFSVLDSESGPATAPPATPTRQRLSRASLEAYLRKSNITEEGKELVRSYDLQKEDQPLRHVRFADLILPEVPPGTPVMETAYLQSTVVTQAPWFKHHKLCNETCCAQAVAISLKQDEHRIINAVDGPDVSDLLLYGNNLQYFHKFAASELTDAVIPCLQPGVIIHADSYRGPITRFFHEHRPKITVPYVFITSKTDGETPIKFFTEKLDSDPLLMAWYGINPKYAFGADHPKFRMMPLGLTGNRYRQHPDLDLLMKARNYSNPFAGDKSRWTDPALWESARDTTPLLFVKFGMHINALHREVPWAMGCAYRTMEPLDNISCNMKIGANPRQTYTAASKYLFGLSPPGNGLDCYRTYELLANGVIPIVQHQPEYEELFQDLPILQLKHWNYTQQQLVEVLRSYIFSSDFLNNTFDAGWERLFLKYWRHKVLQDAGRLNEIITDPDGNQYYKAWQYSLYKPPYIEHAIPEHVKIRKEREEAKRLQGITELKAKKDRELLEEQKRREEEQQRKEEAAEERQLDDDQRQLWNDIDRVKREIEEARRFARETQLKTRGVVGRVERPVQQGDNQMQYVPSRG